MMVLVLIRIGEGHLLGQMDSVISWNVREINCLKKQKDVKNFLNIRSLGLAGLIETKVKVNHISYLYQNVFGGWCFTTYSTCHPNGRIVQAGSPLSLNVTILLVTTQLIHCWIIPAGGGVGFY